MNGTERGSIWQDGSFPKQCSCGALYSAEAWSGLSYCGVVSGKDDKNGSRFFSDLEIRRCACGTSLAVKLRNCKTGAGTRG